MHCYILIGAIIPNFFEKLNKNFACRRRTIVFNEKCQVYLSTVKEKIRRKFRRIFNSNALSFSDDNQPARMKSELSYTVYGDYAIPNLELSKSADGSISKYGRMRKRYLQEYRPVLYNYLVLSETLYPCLLEIDNAAKQRMEILLPQLAMDAGVTEKLKAADPMKWVGLMNTAKAQEEEIILVELLYA